MSAKVAGIVVAAILIPALIIEMTMIISIVKSLCAGGI